MEPSPEPDRAALRARLETAPDPLWETELLRAAWPGERQLDWPALELYRRHFRLFATLYELADEYRAAGWHLHIHFMRTSLRRLPAADECGHFDPQAGRFCRAALPCAAHPPSDLPAEADSRDFYRDPDNLGWLDAAGAERLAGGAWELLLAWPRAEEAWRTLGLPAGSRPELVKRRYRELARRLHPDTRRAEGTDEGFRELHAAYVLLCETLPFGMP